MNKLIEKYRPMALPVAVIIGLSLASVYAVNFLYGRINSLGAQLGSVDSRNQVLSERLSALQSLTPQIREAVNTTTLAIPDKNPSVYVTGQLRRLATENELALAEFSIFPSGVSLDSASVVSYDISFKVSGNGYENVSSFIKDLSTIIPLVNLVSVNIKTQSSGAVAADIKLATFSAPFPQELPAIDEPLNGLSSGEMETLTILQDFDQPVVSASSGETGAPATPREDPFSLSI